MRIAHDAAREDAIPRRFGDGTQEGAASAYMLCVRATSRCLKKENEREQDRKGASFLVVGSILRQYMYLGEQKTRMDTSDSTELVFTCTVR